MATHAYSTPAPTPSQTFSTYAEGRPILHLGEARERLLDAYSSWLWFERQFLNIARFGAQAAAAMVDGARVDNPGAAFHLPEHRDLPDYYASVRRAGTILNAAGVPLRPVETAAVVRDASGTNWIVRDVDGARKALESVDRKPRRLLLREFRH